MNYLKNKQQQPKRKEWKKKIRIYKWFFIVCWAKSLILSLKIELNSHFHPFAPINYFYFGRCYGISMEILWGVNSTMISTLFSSQTQENGRQRIERTIWKNKTLYQPKWFFFFQIDAMKKQKKTTLCSNRREGWRIKRREKWKLKWDNDIKVKFDAFAVWAFELKTRKGSERRPMK